MILSKQELSRFSKIFFVSITIVYFTIFTFLCFDSINYYLNVFLSNSTGKRLLYLSIFVLVFYLVIGFGIVIHEALHGLWIMIFTGKLNSVKYGFNKNYLAFFANSKYPLSKYRFQITSLTPGIVLGVFPFVYSLYASNPFVMLFGWIFTYVAVGDILIFLKTIKLPKNTMIIDDPNHIGFQIHEKQQNNL